LGRGWTQERGASSNFSHGDFSGLKELQIPPVPLDLNPGFENYVSKEKNGVKPGVENLIKEAFAAGAPLGECNVITHWKNTSKILSTTFERKSRWTVDATCIDNLTSGGRAAPPLFLDVVKDKRTNKREMDKMSKHVFTKMCTASQDSEADTKYGMLVNFMLEFKSRSTSWREEAKRLSIYFGAEVEAYDPEYTKSTSNIDDTPPLSSLQAIRNVYAPNTSKMSPELRRVLKFRTPIWWLQYHLSGVPALKLGLRDEAGIVHEIQDLQIARLPQISKEKRCYWSPQQSLAFGADVLSWMAEVCQSEEFIDKHVRFEYIPQEERISARIVEDGDLTERVSAALQHGDDDGEDGDGEQNP
jgi:hypothetical protein